MKTLVTIALGFAMLSAVGCDNTKTTTDRDRTTTDRNVSTDSANTNAGNGPALDPPDTRENTSTSGATGASDADLPAGVKEKPADELPTPDPKSGGE